MKTPKYFFSELRIYVCNHVVANIPSRRLRSMYYRYIMGFKLGKQAAIHLGVRFTCARGFTIGSCSVVNQDCKLDSRGGLNIGNHVSISGDVIILTAGHDPKTPDFAEHSKTVVTIEDNVFIGARAIILPGVTIHRGAFVAAGAVVNRDVQVLNIVGGVPARPIGIRNSRLDYKTDYSRFLH